MGTVEFYRVWKRFRVGPQARASQSGRLDYMPSAASFTELPRGSIYTPIMGLGPKRPSPLWFSGPNFIIVVYMDPLGKSQHPFTAGVVMLLAALKASFCMSMGLAPRVQGTQ